LLNQDKSIFRDAEDQVNVCTASCRVTAVITDKLSQCDKDLACVVNQSLFLKGDEIGHSTDVILNLSGRPLPLSYIGIEHQPPCRESRNKNQED